MIQYLLLRDEAQALVQIRQRDEIAIDQVDDRLDDTIPLPRLYVANLFTVDAHVIQSVSP